MAEDRVTRSLEKLKSQNTKQQEPKKQNLFFRDVTDMSFEKSDQKESKKDLEEQDQQDNTYIRKVEILMRKMEEVISKMNAGSNYLMFYGQMQELESQFLKETQDIEIHKGKITPQLYNRIMIRKNDILKRKKK